jgi:cobalt-zinc-cadmium resistance protein CzcA
MRSKTIFGLSIIYLTFEDGVEDYWARARVLEKIDEADLPFDIHPTLAPLSGPVGEILRYVVSGDIKYTNMDLRTIQDWNIIPKLLQVPGVADVITFGGLVKQYHIITTPEQLSKYNLLVEDIVKSIKENNISTGGNIIPEGDQAFAIRGIGAIQSMDDIEKIVISSNNGVPVYIKNIASVEVLPMPQSGILGYVARENIDLTPEFVNSGVQGLIIMRRGEDASKVVAGIKAKIEQINKQLPADCKITITYDRGELVNYTIHTVSHTIFEGISIVVIILIFFIGSIRSAIIVATIIPISLLFAFLMLKLTGISANLLSLGAIDFGIIVDSAVVMVENLLRRYKHATKDEREKGLL